MEKKVKQKKPTATADLENYVHDEAKRKNIPTAENQKLVADKDKAVKKLRWKRNPDLDPQLVWRGKDFESDPLQVDAPPIYIQEKIQPRAIIEDLRKRTKERQKGGAPQFDFFHDFNGLPEGWKEDATRELLSRRGHAKDRNTLKYRQLYWDKELGGAGTGEYQYLEDEYGTQRRLREEELEDHELARSRGRVYASDNLTSQKPPGDFLVEYQGKAFRSGAGYWKTGQSQFPRLLRARRVLPTGSTLKYKRFLDDFPVMPIANIWDDTSSGASRSDPKRYVVQTTSRVIERCILMATDPGDLVLDPTCGSGTTAYVAEQWGRRWITLDTSRVALTLARARLMGAKYDYYLLKDSKDGAAKEGEIAGRPPADATFTGNLRHGFIYERAPHVTLRSIANNAEIDVIWERWQKDLEPLRENLNKAFKEGWEEWQVPREADDNWPDATKQLHAQWWETRRARQEEIDDSIARNAGVEYLYDRPYKARGLVRVAGPFTVESLSPHRVLPMGEDPFLEELLVADNVTPSLTLPRKGRGKGDAGARQEKDTGGAVITDFAQVVFENLKTAGVQNTKKGERLMLENLRPFASRTGMIQFQGEYTEKGTRKRAAVSIGPEYDTVGYDLVRRGAREAVDLFDMLIVCGFAFAPEVDDTRLNFGGLTVLKARMNQDLRMADKLKATGAGNLFVVFGEPDIEIKSLPGDMLQVEIRGMDIFDPTTGEVRSSGGKELLNDVAAWFVDHDYDEESFFVRQAYFVGDDPYEGLKRALKAEIDETAWAELNSTVSRPFPRPTSGRICVKVINHFGDEVQKVFSV